MAARRATAGLLAYAVASAAFVSILLDGEFSSFRLFAAACAFVVAFAGLAWGLK